MDWGALEAVWSIPTIVAEEPCRSGLARVLRLKTEDGSFACRLDPMEALAAVEDRLVIQALAAEAGVASRPLRTASSGFSAVIPEVDERYPVATLYEWAEGSPLTFQAADAETLGACLAKLHMRLPGDAGRAFPAVDPVGQAQALVAFLAPEAPSAAVSALAALAERVAGGPLDTGDVGACHGDVLPSNAIAADGLVCMIDFEDAGLRDRSADLASFYIVAAHRAPDLWDAFIDGYSSIRPKRVHMDAVEALTALRGLQGMARNVVLFRQRGELLPPDSWASLESTASICGA